MNNLVKQFIVETFTDPKVKSINFLNQVFLSSRLGHQPDADIVGYLSGSVNKTPYKIYRGISIGSLSEQDKLKLINLKPGDDTPIEFVRPNGSQTVIHTTSNKSVAKRYAKGGELSMVMEIHIEPEQVLFDSNNAKLIFDFKDFDEDIWSYLKIEKEILLLKDANFKSKIFSIDFI